MLKRYVYVIYSLDCFELGNIIKVFVEKKKAQEFIERNREVYKEYDLELQKVEFDL